LNYFNFHTHQFTNNPFINELVNKYPTDSDFEIPFFSIGIHPWYINETRIESDLEVIETKIQFKNCLALGECGLDKNSSIDFELQKKVVELQLQLAQKYNKPVVIHCVKAFQEIIEIKKKLKITVPLIIHGFSKNSQQAKSLIDNGFYLSFGNYLVKNPNLKEVFNSIPNDRFFLETDTLIESIEFVYEIAAQYKKITLTDLHQIISNNFATVFKQELN
jgi:TatD DNase family protein